MFRTPSSDRFLEFSRIAWVHVSSLSRTGCAPFNTPYFFGRALFHVLGARMTLNVRTKPSSKARCANNVFMAQKYLRVVLWDQLKVFATSVVAVEQRAFSPASLDRAAMMAIEDPYDAHTTANNRRKVLFSSDLLNFISSRAALLTIRSNSTNSAVDSIVSSRGGLVVLPAVVAKTARVSLQHYNLHRRGTRAAHSERSATCCEMLAVRIV